MKPERFTDFHQGHACRALWGEVVLNALNEYRLEAKHALSRDDKAVGAVLVDRIKADARRYFASRDGRAVMAMAGIEPDSWTPAVMAALAVDQSQLENMAGSARRAPVKKA